MLLKDFVNMKLVSADKEASAEGYPLKMENCKKHKKMRDLKVYGNSFQDGIPTPDNPIEVQSVGELVTDENDTNYGKYKIPVVSRGINYFNSNSVTEKSYTSNGITFTFLDNERIHIKGKLADTTKEASHTFSLKEAIPVKTGEVYNCFSHEAVWQGYSAMFKAVDDNNSFIVNINNAGSNSTISREGSIKYLVIIVKVGTEKEWDDIIPIQLIKGKDTRYTPYEPYVEPVTTNIFLDEPLRKIGDYADYIDFKGNKVIRRNREVIPKPEDIIYEYKFYGSSYGYYIYGTDKTYTDAYVDEFSQWRDEYIEKASHFKACNRFSNGVIVNGWYINGNRLLITPSPEFQASDGVSSTIEDIRAWMQSQIDAGTPLKFTYRLAEPTEELLNMELPKLKAKTTIIEVDTSLAPSSIYGKYIKK